MVQVSFVLSIKIRVLIFKKQLCHFWYGQKYILLIAAILLVSEVKSQSNESVLLIQIDKLPQNQHDSIYYELFKITRESDPSKAKHYASNSFKIAEIHRHFFIQAKACNALAYLYSVNNQIDSSMLYYHKTIRISASHNFKDRLMYFYNNLGILYDRLDMYDSSLYYYQLSYDLALELQSYLDLAIARHNMGLIYSHLENYGDALLYLNEAIDIKRKHGITIGLNTDLLNTANLHNEIGHYDEAVRQLNEIKKNCSNNCDADILANLNYGLGYSYFKKGLLKDACSFFIKAFEYSMQSNNNETLASTYYHLSLFDINNKEYPKAIEKLLQAEKISKAIELRRLQCDVYAELSRVYAKTGASEKEFYYKELHFKIKDSLFNKTLANNILNIELSAQRKQAESTIQQKNMELQKSYLTTFLIGIICILSFIVIYLIYRSLRNSRTLKRKLEDEIIKRTFDLQQTNKELYRSQLEFNHILYRTSQYIRPPLASISGLINIARQKNINLTELRECIEKMHKVSTDFDVILNLLTELYDIRDQEIVPEKIDVNSLITELYRNFEASENFPVVSLSIDNSVGKELKTDKNLLVNLILRSIQYFNPNEGTKSIDVSFAQDDSCTIISLEDKSILTYEMLQQNMFNLFLAQITAFKLKGHILLAERNNQTIFRVIIPNDLIFSCSNLLSSGKQLIMT